MTIAVLSQENPADVFIRRWSPSGGAELSNYGDFITELCALIGTAPPNPTLPDEDKNTYVKEKKVTFRRFGQVVGTGRIDCYKKDCFVLEAKQGVNPDQGEDADPTDLVTQTGPKKKGHGVRGTKGWDNAMIRAREQAQSYAEALPEWPPFLIVVDVGHEIQLFASFSRTGKDYTHFPDASSFRIRMADLRRPEIRTLLKTVWEDPLSLDPSKHAAKVTREIAGRLAVLAKSLEAAGHPAETVATFLMRCLFTMFAEDVGLLPKDSFRELLRNLRSHPQDFVSTMRVLWKSMNDGDFCGVLTTKVIKFNGGLFKHADALPLTPEQLELLIQAAEANWRDVEPAIFGTLLERALDKKERHKLGAHYTPRAYVERLVLPTVIEPLREEWDAVKVAAAELERDAAVAVVTEFHRKLCETRVLDPACGTGNFLYVTMELMKKLEGEVLDFLSTTLDVRQDALDLSSHTVDPHQFLGIEVNPRAAAIAELVIWIGYLQWHFRTRGKVMPAEPVLKDFKNIECRDAILAWDRTEVLRDKDGKPVTRWDGVTMKKHPVTGEDVPDETARVELLRYVKPRPAKWPKAEYIVGNPPFIGNKRMLDLLGEGYCSALRNTYADNPDSIDFVMYWWGKAADQVVSKIVRRAGLITTNSLRQKFNQRLVRQKFGLGACLVFAVPDHPWVTGEDGAAVRVAMTTIGFGKQEGILTRILEERACIHGDYEVTTETLSGTITADITIGADVNNSYSLKSNLGLCGQGMKLVGDGFNITPNEAHQAGIDLSSPAIRRIMDAGDIKFGRQPGYIIDFFELSLDEARNLDPKCLNRLITTVKPFRDENKRDSLRKLWWRFAWERPVIRNALQDINRYFVTLETSKHRFFVAVEGKTLWDGTLFAVAASDYWIGGILGSKIHVVWSESAGSLLGPTGRYNNTRCFDPFPFPDPPEKLKSRIRALGERLDSFRKERQAEHPDLTLTQMYNVLERLRELDRDASAKPLDAKEKAIHEKGLVSVLRQIHDELDRAVFDAYGWPHDLGDEQILERLVALNKERAAEEKRGIIRWLRPEFQAPKTAKPVQTAMDVGEAEPAAPLPAAKLPWPKPLPEQVQQVRAILVTLGKPATAKEVARTFKSAPAPRVADVLESLAAMGKAWKMQGTDRYAA